jgi:hypothetical protein
MHPQLFHDRTPKARVPQATPHNKPVPSSTTANS